MKDNQFFDYLEQAGREAAEKARAAAWAANLPYSYGLNGKVIRVYPDGRRMKVICDEKGNVKEIEYSDE
jgi:hypothetical protein